MARKKKTQSGLDESLVLKAFHKAQKPLHRGEILRMIGAGRREKNELKDVLDSLIHQGKILRLKRGAFGLAENLKIVTGRLEVQRSGVGFLIPDDPKRKDIYLGHNRMGDAWHGDRVAVAVLPKAKKAGREDPYRREEGRVVRVIERAVTRMAVRAIRRVGEKLFLCQPTDPKLDFTVMADVRKLEREPMRGDIVIASPGDKLEPGLWAAEALEALGDELDVDVQERLVKMNHQVPTEFPSNAVHEAESFPPNPGEDDFKGRLDLREAGFVTIDGAKARDFDDAILVDKDGSGWRLRVAIADVSHYVQPASALDREARARGNSYYFPRSVEPMFPEALSNGLCSLNPDVPRLAMVADMRFDSEGRRGKATFHAAVIRSAARLTYMQVYRALLSDDPEERAKEAENITHVLPMLQRAEALARAMHDRRRERGTIDFDLPEPEIHFNVYGETEDITPRPRNFAHQLIEEFMIAANEAVAEHLTQAGPACMYRVHPAPDAEKLNSLFETLSRTPLAQSMPTKPKAADLPDILRAAKGTDQEFLVGRLALRTMMQASYTPIHEGHYGLASECYCHFTSPIRRYADLVVHRALKVAIGIKTEDEARLKGLKRLGDELSVLERRAMEAEREILKRVCCLFLRNKVGQVFDAVINGMSDFGFWVELDDVLAEGMVRLSSLTDDYYGFLPERQEILGERTGNRFYLGQHITVRLMEVSMARLEVQFELAGKSRPKGSGGTKPSRKPTPPGKGKTASDRYADLAKARKARQKGKPKGGRKGGGSRSRAVEQE